MMKCFVLLVIAVSAVFAAPPPGCTFDDLKKCNIPMVVHNISEACELFNKDDNCVYEFNNRCIKNPKAKKIADEIHAGVVKHFNEVCGTDQGQQDFVERVNQCYFKPEVVYPLAKIQKRYVGLVEKFATYDKNDVLPSFCCAVLYLRENDKAINTKECSKDIADYHDNALKAIFQTPFHEECGDVSSYDQCASSKLNAAHQADFKQIIDANPPLPTKNVDALPTLFDLFNKYFNN